MKKFLKILTTLCLVVVAGTLLAACGETDGITHKDGGDALYGASITSWWKPTYQEEHQIDAIDTSVTFDFDKIKIADIDKITFEIFDGNTSMGSAVSEGEKLVALFNESKVYWTKDGDDGNYDAGTDYKTITGRGRILSCNFYEIENAEDAQAFTNIWTYSATTVKYVDGKGGDGEKVPNKLVVKVLVGKTEYTTSRSYTVPVA